MISYFPATYSVGGAHDTSSRLARGYPPHSSLNYLDAFDVSSARAPPDLSGVFSADTPDIYQFSGSATGPTAS